MYADYSQLYRMLSRRYSRSRHDDVCEAIQAAAVVTYEATVLRESPRNLEAYMTTVARRTLTKILNERTRRSSHPLNNSGDHEIYDEEMLVADLPKHDEEIDAHSIIKRLPLQYSDLLRQHYLEGKPLEEIARNSGVSGACIRKRHERALKRARVLFGISTKDSAVP